MKLLAYSIGGQPVGITVKKWAKDDLSGNPAFIVSDNNVAGYIDVTSIEHYDKYGPMFGLDPNQKRFGIVEAMTIAGGFASLSNADKDIVGMYNAATDNEMITHYATVHTAGDIDAAIQMHTEKVGAFIGEMKEIATYRAEHSATTACILQYMKDRGQIDSFISAINNFLTYYKVKFHVGTQYGDTSDGIMDYLENTGGYAADNTGLDSYEFSDAYKQIWYAGNAVDPQNPTVQEQESAHVYVRDLLKNRLKYILLYGNI